MYQRVSILTGLFCWVLLNAARAQFSDETYLYQRDVLGLEDIVEQESTTINNVISASRSTRQLDDLPITIFTITGEEIRKNGWVTLADVLKTLPGIRVSQPGSGEDGETFLMRGFIGNKYTKILINNIPVQPSVLSGFPIGAQLPVRQAERIEVIYGPAAAIYGADAASGVINIITKKADKTMFAQADVSVGDYGYEYLNFMAGGKAGRNKNILNYSIYGSSFKRADLSLDRNSEAFNPLSFFKANQYQYSEQQAMNAEMITDEFLASMGLTAEEFFDQLGLPHFEGTIAEPKMSRIPQSSSMVGVELNYKGLNLAFHDMHRQDHSSLGRSTGVFKYHDPKDYWGENIKRVSLSINMGGPRLSSNTNLSYLRYRLDENTTIGRTYGPSDKVYQYAASDDIFIEQLLIYAPLDNLELIGGASYQHSGNLPTTNDLDQPFQKPQYKAFRKDKPPPHPLMGDFGYNPIVFNNVAGFFQLFWNYRDFSVIAGLRQDYNSLYGGTTNPRVAVLYKANPNTRLRASAGSAFKAPSSNLSYQSIAYSQFTSQFAGGGGEEGQIEYAVIPNPDLKPEIFESYELGLYHKFKDQANLDFSIYYNRIENLISSNSIIISRQDYPLALYDTVRSYLNSSVARSKLLGIQASLKYQDIIPDVDIQLNSHLAVGEEFLPVDSSRISDFRMLPDFMGQLSIMAEPIKNLYLRIDNVFMSSWLRRYTPNARASEDPFFRINGYFATDFMTRYYMNNNLSMFFKLVNVFNQEYAGIGAIGLDVDMRYTPQLKRNFQLGISFNFE